MNTNSAERGLELSVLKTVRELNHNRTRKLTFGQIYMKLIQLHACVPSIAQCLQTVDELVKEGLLVSEKMLDKHLDFPYPQHLISGLTDIGAASLMSEEEMTSGSTQ
jgi:hypothetical protein